MALFPWDEISQSLLRPFCLHSSSFLSGESEPFCRESVALSPETKLVNRFYGHSACIPRPSYQGKVNHFAANLRHFPAGNVDFIVIFVIFSRKVNRISTNSRHFPPVILFPALFCIYAFGESEPICHFPGHKQRSGSSSTSRQKFRWRNVQQLAERAIMNE